ncbi:MAG: SDR family NAD(P)-dependent oxidoreductase [Cyanobacteria bacterium]|nr:SDR family NAD(P)-dependent oxidoreductase [Cyanobacteriota bacterium]
MTSRNGRIVLITGGNRGLGKEIGRQLGHHGCTVILAARDERAGEAAAAELTAAGCEAHSVRLDVTNSDHIDALVSHLDTTFGRVDVLINNAGIALEMDGMPTNADKIRRTLEVNLIAPYAITQALLPLLARSEDARVINQSSILGSMDAAHNRWHEFEDQMTVGYSTSKAALGMLTLIQAKRLASQGILVAASHPGWVKTDLGGEDAPMELQEGAHTVVHLVTMAREHFPHSHMHHRGERVPW